MEEYQERVWKAVEATLEEAENNRKNTKNNSNVYLGRMFSLGSVFPYKLAESLFRNKNEYEVLVDCPITGMKGKKKAKVLYPDIVIIDKETQQLKAIIEVKLDCGWIRAAELKKNNTPLTKYEKFISMVDLFYYKRPVLIKTKSITSLPVVATGKLIRGSEDHLTWEGKPKEFKELAKDIKKHIQDEFSVDIDLLDSDDLFCGKYNEEQRVYIHRKIDCNKKAKTLLAVLMCNNHNKKLKELEKIMELQEKILIIFSKKESDIRTASTRGTKAKIKKDIETNTDIDKKISALLS